MTTVFYNKNLLNFWKSQDAITKISIIAALILVVFAYLPTLQFDYVTQDQWRAFRYSSNEQSFYARLYECSSMLAPHYAQTGRPFAWSECLEHAFVSKISDFKYLRPAVLAVVIFTVIYLSRIINKLTGEMVTALVVSAVFVTAPAYSFMYLQGLPALMVLISVILAATSYNYYLDSQCRTSVRYKLLIKSSLLFLAACMIYPAFAFIVLPLALINFSIFTRDSAADKIKQLAGTLVYYGSLSGIYYLITKLFVVALTFFKENIPSLDRYEVSVQLSPIVIFDRMNTVANYIYNMPPLNFSTHHGISLGILVVFSILVSFRSSEITTLNTTVAYLIKNIQWANIFLQTIILVILVFAVLILSTSPWLFSKMTAFAWQAGSTGGLQTRHLLPIYLFLSFASVWILKEIFRSAFRLDKNKISLLIVLLVLFPISVIQNRNSFLEVASSQVEIEALRSKLKYWGKMEDWSNQRFILIVRPERSRPLGIDNLFSDDDYGNDNTVLASSQNPVSIPWMVNAILREEFGDRKFNVVDCGFDTEACVSVALVNQENIVVAYVNGRGAPKNDFIKCPSQPYVVNISELTSKPVNPVIKIVESPSISATSTLDDFGPQGLFIKQPPGWHAKRNPEYPQVLTFDLKEKKYFGSISLLPQDKTLIARAPKAVRVKISSDGQLWHTVVQGGDMCSSNSPGGWHQLKLPNIVEAQYLEIDILSNCGDPEFLTLRGLKIE